MGEEMTDKICPFMSRSEQFDINKTSEGDIIPDSGVVFLPTKCQGKNCMAWREQKFHDKEPGCRLIP